MIKEIFFNELKVRYLQLSEQIAKSPINQDDLLIDYKDNLNDLFIRDLRLLKDAKDLLKKAQLVDDKVTIQAALVYIRVYSMRLSGFFEDFKDDADMFLKSSEWPDIPEDYQVPTHYNYPHK
ncbi:hypothetical protein GEA64_14975 [Photorhabdus khanii]|uniref:Uncharacterized protein n=1 Tax=Photorhabdus khanii TaxID=1004150 RepID=A0A7C9KSN4_9GAMM|nr:hypothetical protein [Photorhabdus khanii]MQL49183.1 hypothetical protein [Photorhabdus khanii]